MKFNKLNEAKKRINEFEREWLNESEIPPLPNDNVKKTFDKLMNNPEKFKKMLQQFFGTIDQNITKNLIKWRWEKEKYAIAIDWIEPNTKKQDTAYFGAEQIAKSVNINYYSEAANIIKSFEKEWLNEGYYQKPEPKYTSGQAMDDIDNVLAEIKPLIAKLPWVERVNLVKDSIKEAVLKVAVEIDAYLTDEDEEIKKLGNILQNLISGKFKENQKDVDGYLMKPKYMELPVGVGNYKRPDELDTDTYKVYNSPIDGFLIFEFRFNRLAGKNVPGMNPGERRKDLLSDAIAAVKTKLGNLTHYRDRGRDGIIRVKFEYIVSVVNRNKILHIMEEILGDALIDVKIIKTISWGYEDSAIAAYIDATKLDAMNRELGYRGYKGDENHRNRR